MREMTRLEVSFPFEVSIQLELDWAFSGRRLISTRRTWLVEAGGVTAQSLVNLALWMNIVEDSNKMVQILTGRPLQSLGWGFVFPQITFS